MIPGPKSFDPFPFHAGNGSFYFCNILSISFIINQKRQGRIEKIREQVEFKINVRAESEITKVLQMLHEIDQKLGINTAEDKELEKMKQQTNLDEIQQTVDHKPKTADFAADKS